MRLRDFVSRTKWCQHNKSGICEWFEILPSEKEEYIELRMPEDVLQCPDVCLYIVRRSSRNSEKYISYLKFKWSDLVNKYYINLCKAPEWYHFKPMILSENASIVDNNTGDVLLGMRVCKPKDRPAAGTGLPKQNEVRPFLTSYSDTTTATLELTVTIVNARNVPAMNKDGTSCPLVAIKMNDITKETSIQKNTLSPTWNESFVFKEMNGMNDIIEFSIWNWNRILMNDKIGNKQINIMSILHDAGLKWGTNGNFTTKYYCSSEYANMVITVNFEFKFLRKDIASSNNSGGLGVAVTRSYQLSSYVYKGSGIKTNYNNNNNSNNNDDKNDMMGLYLVLNYGGESCKTRIVVGDSDPIWMECFRIACDIIQPVEYAPPIHASVMYGDNRNDNGNSRLVGTFSIPFRDVVDMMKCKSGRWYRLNSRWISMENRNLTLFDDDVGRVFIAIELITPTQVQRPLFKIDKRAYVYYLHVLTLGLRQYSSLAQRHEIEIISPDSNEKCVIEMDGINACAIASVAFKLSFKYELAPTINIKVTDSLFGGLIKKQVARGMIDTQDYFEFIRAGDEKGRDYTIRKIRSSVIDEDEIENELMAERVAEKREYVTERKCKLLSIMKTIYLTEKNKGSVSEELSNIINTAQTKWKHLKIETADDREKRIRMENALRSREDNIKIENIDIDENNDKDYNNSKKKSKNIEILYGDYNIPQKDFTPNYLVSRGSVRSELEDEMNCQPFPSWPLFQGDKSNKSPNGQIKGFLMVNDSHETPSAFEDILNSILPPSMINFRVYVLDAYSMVLPVSYVPNLDGNKCYLVIKLGKDVKRSNMCDVSDKSTYNNYSIDNSNVNRKVRNRIKRRNKKNTINKTGISNFFEMFEFNGKLPGVTDLIIQVWMRLGGTDKYDGNSSNNDELIGQSIIDVENRWYSQQWRGIQRKPVEIRDIRNPRSTTRFGKLRLWLDMCTVDNLDALKYNISLPSIQEWNLRLIIWKGKNILNKYLTKESDLFGNRHEFQVKCKLNVNNNKIQTQETDVHWGKLSNNSEASWNWRMIFNIRLQYFPIDKNSSNDRLELSLYDYTNIDLIGENSILLDKLLKHCYFEYNENGLEMIELTQNKNSKFWIKLNDASSNNTENNESSAEFDNFENDVKSNGVTVVTKSKLESKSDKSQENSDMNANNQETVRALEISIQLLSNKMVEKYPAGIGRGYPNSNPHLPAPRRATDVCRHCCACYSLYINKNMYKQLCNTYHRN